MTACVMVVGDVAAGKGAEFVAAYNDGTATVKGTPGHVHDELLQERGRPGRYILLSEWESLADCLARENGPTHHQLTTPMRPWWAGRVERIIYEVAGGAPRVADESIDSEQPSPGRPAIRV